MTWVIRHEKSDQYLSTIGPAGFHGSKKQSHAMRFTSKRHAEIVAYASYGRVVRLVFSKAAERHSASVKEKP